MSKSHRSIRKQNRHGRSEKSKVLKGYVKGHNVYISHEAMKFADSHNFTEQLWELAKSHALSARSWKFHQLSIEQLHVSLALI